ncbi:MAG: TPM domain-containing protein [bacterium]|nr:TPM domain-containing protein [bacterium]
MKKRFLIALLLLPTLTLAYTSPGKSSGFVNDFAEILKPETVSSLNRKLEQFSKDTGNEIVVVTILKLEDETIETYAEKLFQEWGIGKEKKDNGLLLLVSIEDRAVRIEVGYGLEPLVTDIGSGRIIREILTPAFQAEDFDGGIMRALDTIIKLIGGEEMPNNSDSISKDWFEFFPYVIFFLIYLGAILGRSKSWWAGGIVGGIFGIVFFSSVVSIGIYILIGLIFDFIVSRVYSHARKQGGVPPWWIGGGGGNHSGGFGGGMSGGGGASGRW